MGPTQRAEKSRVDELGHAAGFACVKLAISYACAEADFPR